MFTFVYFISKWKGMRLETYITKVRDTDGVKIFLVEFLFLKDSICFDSFFLIISFLCLSPFISNIYAL